MDKYPHIPAARPGSPETAFEAAESIADAAKSREAKAFALFRSVYPAGRTADEVADHFEWERYSARPRLSQLKARGQIVDSGERRQGASGRRQVVWVAAGIEAQPSFLPLIARQ